MMGSGCSPVMTASLTRFPDLETSSSTLPDVFSEDFMLEVAGDGYLPPRPL